jgi:hypothetical protein
MLSLTTISLAAVKFEQPPAPAERGASNVGGI